MRALTQSSLVRALTSLALMASTWSPSTMPPQEQAAREAGEDGEQHWGEGRECVTTNRQFTTMLITKPS